MTGNTTEQIEFDIAVDKSSAESSLTRLSSLVASLESKVIHLGASFNSMGKTAYVKGMFAGSIDDIQTMNDKLKSMRATLKTTGTVDINNFNKQFGESVSLLGSMQKGVDGLVISQKRFSDVQKSAQTIDLKRIDYATNLANIEDRTLRTRQATVNGLKIELAQLQKVSTNADTTLKTAQVRDKLERAIVDVKDQEQYLADKALMAKEKATKLTAQEYAKEVEALALRAKTSTYYNASNDALTTALGKKRNIVKEEIAYLRVLKDANIEGVLDNQIAKQTLNLRSSIKDMQVQTYKEHAKLNTEGTVTQAQLDKQLKAEAALGALKIQETNQQQRSGALSNNTLYTLQQNAKVLKEQVAYYESINKNGALDNTIQKTKTELATNFTNQTKAQASAQVSMNKQREIALNQLKREEAYNATLTTHAAKRAVGYSVLYAGIAAVTAVVGASVKNFLEADLQMRTLAAVLKINTERASILSNSIRALGETFGGSLKEIEDVSLALARAGVASKDMVPATELVLKMARLTGDTFAESAKAIISFQQVFGDTTSLDTLGNKLAYIANVSRLSTQDIGTFSNYALAAAKSVGMTEDAVGGLAAAFSNAGVNASTIGTEIRTFTGILTNSSEDVTDFFLGLGVNQQGLAREVQKGGKASNDAILGFVDTLSKLDKSDFNRLTGNMDKLTTNVLALMRNNKVNITEFTRDLEAGAEGQLKQVDTIIAAHQVKLESTWNTILNDSQKFMSALEKGLTKYNLDRDIGDTQGKINSGYDVDMIEYTQEEKKALEDKLKVLLSIKAISKEERDLAAIQGKIAKATGAEWVALKDQEYIQLKKIGDLRSTIEGTVKVRSKEEIAELQKIKEEYLKTQEAKLQGMEKTSEGYKLQQQFVKELTAEVKKLKDESDSIKPIKVIGADYDSAGKNIKSKLNAGDILSTSDIKIYNDAIDKALANIKQSMDSTFTVQVDKGFGAQVALAKELIGTQGDISRATQEAQAQSNALAALEQQLADTKKSGDKDQMAIIQEEIDKRRASTEAFIDMVNSLQALFGKKDTILRDQRDIEEAQAAAVEKRTEAINKVAVAEAKLNAAKGGGKAPDILDAEIKALEKQLEVLDKKAKASGSDKDVIKAAEVRTALYNKETEHITASNSERAKTEKLLSNILDLEARRDIALAKIEGRGLGDLQVAKLVLAVQMQKANEQAKLGDLLEAEVTRAEALLKFKEETHKFTKREAELQIEISETQAKITNDWVLRKDIIDRQYRLSLSEIQRLKEEGKIKEASLLEEKANLEYQESILLLLQEQTKERIRAWKANQLARGIPVTADDEYNETLKAQADALERIKVLQQENGRNLDYAKNILTKEHEDDVNNKLQKQLDLNKELRDIQYEMANATRAAQYEQLQSLLAYNEGLDDQIVKVQSIASAVVGGFQSQSKYSDEIASKTKKYNEDRQKYIDNYGEGTETVLLFEKNHTAEMQQLESKRAQERLSDYGSIFGAMSNFYDEDDARREKQQKIAEAFHYIKMAQQVAEMMQSTAFTSLFVAQESAKATAAGITAVATAAQSSPWTGFATAAGMIALLASIGLALGAGGSGKEYTNIGKAPTENTGTGTVLGDASAQSESMRKSLEILEEYKKPEFQVLQSMNKYLEGILNSLGGVSSLIVQRGGKAFGAGYVDSYSSSYNMELDSIINSGMTKALNSIGGALTGSMFAEKLTGSSITSVLSGQKLTEKLAQGIFGKTSSWSELKGYGIAFGNQLLKDAVNEIFGSEYQTIKKTTKTSSWLKGTSETSKTKTKYYDMAGFTETERQFSLILDNMYNSVYEAGVMLGENSETLINNLDNFVVSLGHISFKGKSGGQIQTDLEAIFGAVGDSLAGTVMPVLVEYQSIGEGLFETLTKVATGMEVADYYAERLGTAFEVINFRDIENKQGDIGFEALLQTIEKFDEALYGVDNNLMLIVENIDGTAEELYGVYSSLSNLRDMLAFMNIDTDAVSYSTIRGAGSAEALVESVNSYFENFFSDAEQLEFKTQQLRKEFTKLNKEMPTTKEGFKELVEEVSNSDQELYGRLILLSEAFSEVFSTQTDTSTSIQESARSIMEAWTGSLSYLTNLQKSEVMAKMANESVNNPNYDALGIAMTRAQLSKNTAKTKEDYMPIFNQYLEEVIKAQPEATLDDVVSELKVLILRVEDLEDTTRRVG